MLFAVPAAPAGALKGSVAPVASVKEILTGMQPVRNDYGDPVMSAEANREIMKSLSKFDVCDSFCCRRDMLARAVAAAAVTIGAPALAAADKQVKVGADNGNLQFVPDEVAICKGDTVTWIGNKALPHNIVFDVDEVPDGVDADKISKSEYMNEPGEKFTQTFTITGTYAYYCEPHRGAGMAGKITVSA